MDRTNPHIPKLGKIKICVEEALNGATDRRAVSFVFCKPYPTYSILSTQNIQNSLSNSFKI